MLDTVEGSHDVDNDYKTVQAVIYGILPNFGDKHEQVCRRLSRSKTELLIREKDAAMQVVTNGIHHCHFEDLDPNRREGDRSVVRRIGRGKLLMH